MDGRAPIENPLARGFYTVPQAARLIRVGSTNRIYGWLRGYPDRQVGPLLDRDYQPIADNEELSFLDLMEVRFVETFREAGVKLRSLRIAAQRLREELQTPHPFAQDRMVLVADQVDVLVEEILRDSAAKASDPRLRSLLSRNYVMYEAIKQSLLPGVRFDTATHLAREWAPIPDRFPKIVMRPHVSYGQPTGPSRVPTGVLFDAWVAENENADAVSHWYEVPLAEVLEAIEFEHQLDRPNEARAA
ncbi:MAG: hypothetical protein ACREDL_00910 [Bradyrhizobium sp.]